jgi:hypothetical protein
LAPQASGWAELERGTMAGRKSVTVYM